MLINSYSYSSTLGKLLLELLIHLFVYLSCPLEEKKVFLCFHSIMIGTGCPKEKRTEHSYPTSQYIHWILAGDTDDDKYSCAAQGIHTLVRICVVTIDNYE